MKIIERLILQHRAKKCKNNDKIGIKYLTSTIKKGQTVVDIGGHKAGYLYWMVKEVGDTGNVYVFEPQSLLFQYIKKIKRYFNWKNVTVEHLALSDSEGSVTLYIPINKWRKSSPGASVVAHKGLQNIRTTETIATETLDVYCSRHDIKPDFLKIDVEGNELRVLQGSIKTLKKYKPKILIEIEARHVGEKKVLETFNFMKDLGYKGHFIHTANQLPLSSFCFDKHQNTNNQEKYCNNFIFE